MLLEGLINEADANKSQGGQSPGASPGIDLASADSGAVRGFGHRVAG